MSGRVAPAEAVRHGLAVAELALRLPSLDEVFLALTGKPALPTAHEGGAR
nr:hypothetical protein [Amycolatopsis sp. MEP2-6]